MPIAIRMTDLLEQQWLPGPEGLALPSARKRGFEPTKDVSTADFRERACTMSPEKEKYIWHKTISHIEVVLGSGVFPV